jgi:hypothetical protein
MNADKLRPVTAFACGIFQSAFMREWVKKEKCCIEVIQRENVEGFMKRLAVIAVILISALAGATTISEYDSKSAAEKSACIVNFIDKMTTDMRAKNPELAQSIRDWFAVKQPGKPLSEGMERLFIELTAVELQAKDGKVDLSKIQMESMIVWVVKQKFPPPAKQ